MNLHGSRCATRDLALVLATLAFVFGLAIATMTLAMILSHPVYAGVVVVLGASAPGRKVQPLNPGNEPRVERMSNHLAAARTIAVLWTPSPQAIVHKWNRGPIDVDRDRRAFLLDAARHLYAPPTEFTQGLATGQTHCCPR